VQVGRRLHVVRQPLAPAAGEDTPDGETGWPDRSALPPSRRPSSSAWPSPRLATTPARRRDPSAAATPSRSRVDLQLGGERARVVRGGTVRSTWLRAASSAATFADASRGRGLAPLGLALGGARVLDRLLRFDDARAVALELGGRRIAPFLGLYRSRSRSASSCSRRLSRSASSVLELGFEGGDPLRGAAVALTLRACRELGGVALVARGVVRAA
jgi:hypothetical protein